jgi:AbrB family transcriptional regulator (stage V sporulation protein T)
MKATGIVRRIDDLGRVVVPKEIRRTLRIREGDPLEIFTEKDGSVVLKKYSPIGELSECAKFFSGAIGNVIDRNVVICDKDIIICASGGCKKEYLNKPISKQLETMIDSRAVFIKNSAEEGTCIPVYEGEEIEHIFAQVICPVISEGQTIGAVVVIGRNAGDTFGEVEAKSAEVAAVFLGSQMEQ